MSHDPSTPPPIGPNAETIRAMMEGRDLPAQPGFRIVSLADLFGSLNEPVQSNQIEQPEGEARWLAEIDYRHDGGIRTKVHALDELYDLDEIVEAGPHWDTVDTIRIKRINHINGPGLTVEFAETL